MRSRWAENTSSRSSWVSGVAGSAASTSERSRRVSGCRASAPVRTPSGVPYASRARRASSGRRSPTERRPGVPPWVLRNHIRRTTTPRKPGPFPVLHPTPHHQPRPHAPQPLPRPLGPLVQSMSQHRRHLLRPVEQEQQRPPRVTRHPRQPFGGDVAEVAGIPGGGTDAATIRAARSTALRTASATDVSSSRRSAPRSHSVGAGSAPPLRRAASAASSVVRPLPGGPTRPSTAAGLSRNAANSLARSGRSTGSTALAGPTKPASAPDGPSEPTEVAVSSRTPARLRSAPYAGTVAALRARRSSSGSGVAPNTPSTERS